MRIFVDRYGEVFGIATVPDCNQDRISRLSQRVVKFDAIAKDNAVGQSKRGIFKTVSYGISKGPGSKVVLILL